MICWWLCFIMGCVYFLIDFHVEGFFDYVIAKLLLICAIVGMFAQYMVEHWHWQLILLGACLNESIFYFLFIIIINNYYYIIFFCFCVLCILLYQVLIVRGRSVGVFCGRMVSIFLWMLIFILPDEYILLVWWVRIINFKFNLLEIKIVWTRYYYDLFDGIPRMRMHIFICLAVCHLLWLIDALCCANLWYFLSFIDMKICYVESGKRACRQFSRYTWRIKLW